MKPPSGLDEDEDEDEELRNSPGTSDTSDKSHPSGVAWIKPPVAWIAGLDKAPGGLDKALGGLDKALGGLDKAPGGLDNGGCCSMYLGSCLG